MVKNRLYLSLIILLLVLTLSGGQVLQTRAAPLEQDDFSGIIDEQVWQEILASPRRETTFLVQLSPDGEKAVDAQFRLEKNLMLMQEAGSLKDYQAYYGRNLIKITGGAGVLHFLEDWPELKKVTAYQPGEDRELDTLSAREVIESDRSSQITGKVMAVDGVTNLSGVEVTAYQQTGPVDWFKYPSALSASDGSYTISGLASGTYRVRFDDPSGNYVTEYYDNKTSFGMATNLEVNDGEEVPNINASLASAGKITGTITFDSGGGSEEGLIASAWSNDGSSWTFVMNAITNESGEYTIAGLSPGAYRVRFSDSSLYEPPRYVTEYYNNKLDITNAQDVVVTAGTTISGINAALGSYGSVSGNVKAGDGTTNLADIVVDVYRYDSAIWQYFASGITDTSGNYEVFGLGTENVRVWFFDPLDLFAAEFYNNKPDLDSADNVAVSLSNVTSDINAELLLISDVVTFAKQTNGEDVENAPGPYIAVGDSVNWTYIITNNSDGSFTFSIVDDPVVMISCPTNVLLSGESTTCTASATAVEGQFTNTATVTVTPPGDLIPFDIQDISHYFGYKPSGLTLTKFTNGLLVEDPPGPEILVGNTVTWTYEVTNDSNARVTNLSVEDDDPAVTVSCAKDQLEGNETITCSASGEVIEGQYSNSAQASGIFIPTEGEITSPTASSYYYGVIGSKLFLPLILR